MVFVVIDGLDGSGKSTQARLICRRIAEKGKTYVLRAHPSSDNFFGRLGRGYLLLDGKRARFAASLFYLLDVARSLLLYKWRRVGLPCLRQVPHGHRLSPRAPPQGGVPIPLQAGSTEQPHVLHRRLAGGGSQAYRGGAQQEGDVRVPGKAPAGPWQGSVSHSQRLMDGHRRGPALENNPPSAHGAHRSLILVTKNRPMDRVTSCT